MIHSVRILKTLAHKKYNIIILHVCSQLSFTVGDVRIYFSYVLVYVFNLFRKVEVWFTANQTRSSAGTATRFALRKTYL